MMKHKNLKHRHKLKSHSCCLCIELEKKQTSPKIRRLFLHILHYVYSFLVIGFCPLWKTCCKKTKSIWRQDLPNGNVAAPDTYLMLSDYEQKEASGNIPESLLLPSRPDCWLRNCIELADCSRAFTASREHVRFRRKLYFPSISLL